jgi:FKBP-type peptidyl-prolyl cis-trans isomerase SlyD
MTIQDRKVVSLHYELQVDDENGTRQVADKSEEGHPLVFLYGVGQLLPLFEQNIQGMKPGDTFAFSIPPDEGYGEYDENAVVNLPIDIFKVDGKVDNEMLQPGNTLPMADQEGNPLQGRVMEVTQDSVMMDFNHPLAGFDLHFTGKIVFVRDATLDELSHGHVHGDGGIIH